MADEVKLTKVNLKNRALAPRGFMTAKGYVSVAAGAVAEVELSEDQIKTIKESAEKGGDVEVTTEKPTVDSAAAAKEAADKAAVADRQTADRIAAEQKVVADKAAADQKAIADKALAEQRAIADKAAADQKAAADKAANEKAKAPVLK